MLFDLRGMRGSEDRVEREYAGSAFQAEGPDGYAVGSAVRLSLVVRKDGERYRLRGWLRAGLRLTCSRCLESFETPLDLPIDLRYLPEIENRGETESEIAEEDLTTAFYREDQIDLGHLVREQLQLAVPMKPLCRDDCQGLCPECGTNRNREQCDCAPSWQDPRLEALQSLLTNRGQE